MKHKFLFILIFFSCAFQVIQRVCAELPDLAVTNSDITFSNGSPEPGEVITIPVNVHNNGGISFPLDETPVARHDYHIGASSAGAFVYNGSWLAQYFALNSDSYLNKVSLLIRNYGIATDSITIEIRRDNGFQSPGNTGAYLLASRTLISTFTAYGWQDFVFDTPSYLSAGTTYWICAENYTSNYNDSYLWWIDTGTPVNMLTYSSNQGTNWVPTTPASYNGYFRVYKCTNPVVACYMGDPGSGGQLIGSAISAPIPGGGSKTVSFSWTAVQGSTDIYVAVDYPGPGIIQESLEDNNTACKTITVLPTSPYVTQPVSPGTNSSGIMVTEPVRINFSEEMDSATVKQAILVSAIRDNRGVLLTGSPVAGISEYAGKTLTFSAALEKGYTYQVTISTGAKDLYGNSLPVPVVWTFTTIMDRALENTLISGDNKTSVTLKPLTVDNDYYVVVDTNPLTEQSLSGKVIAANGKIKKIRGNFSSPLGNSARKIGMYKGALPGTEYKEKFSRAAYVEIPYVEASSGLVEDSNGFLVKEKTLGMYWLDEENSLWVKIPDSVVDTDKNTVKASVNHFSLYALFGGVDADLSAAYAYPVPWKPFAGKGETGSLEQGITFTGLGSEATIRIYTISGELVKALNYRYSGGEEQKKWDGTNEHGELVASGTYIYYIENDKEHKTGKLIIIK